MIGRRMLTAVLAAGVLALAACGGGRGASASGHATRTMLTDYKFDEIAASYFSYFPRVVAVHLGDSINFKQAWTGEPHTITRVTELPRHAAGARARLRS